METREHTCSAPELLWEHAPDRITARARGVSYAYGLDSEFPLARLDAAGRNTRRRPSPDLVIRPDEA